MERNLFYGWFLDGHLPSNFLLNPTGENFVKAGVEIINLAVPDRMSGRVLTFLEIAFFHCTFSIKENCNVIHTKPYIRQPWESEHNIFQLFCMLNNWICFENQLPDLPFRKLKISVFVPSAHSFLSCKSSYFL